MKLLQKLLVRNKTLMLGVTAGGVTQPAMAALPTPVAPSNNPASGDYLGLVIGYVKDGGLAIGLFISVAGFIWISYIALAKFNEARQGKAEWAEVGLMGGVACAILLFISYLLGQAAGVI